MNRRKLDPLLERLSKESNKSPEVLQEMALLLYEKIERVKREGYQIKGVLERVATFKMVDIEA